MSLSLRDDVARADTLEPKVASTLGIYKGQPYPTINICARMQNCILRFAVGSNYAVELLIGGFFRLELIATIDLLSELEIMTRWIVLRSGTSLEEENQ